MAESGAAATSSFDPSDPAVGELTLEALLERECEMQVSRIFQEAERMQTRLRETAGEAREILLAKPTRENEAKLDSLLRDSLSTQ